MPGPVSDSFDPEFGTGENCRAVAVNIGKVCEKIVGRRLGSELKNIVEVVHGPAGKLFGVTLSERDLRVIRFAMNRSLESL